MKPISTITKKEAEKIIKHFSPNIKNIYIHNSNIYSIPFILEYSGLRFYFNQRKSEINFWDTKTQNSIYELMQLTRKIFNFARFISPEIKSIVNDYINKLLNENDIVHLLKGTFYSNLMHPEYNILTNNCLLGNSDMFNEQFIDNFSKAIINPINKCDPLLCTQNSLLESFLRFIQNYESIQRNNKQGNKECISIFTQLIPNNPVSDASETLELIEKNVEKILETIQHGYFINEDIPHLPIDKSETLVITSECELFKNSNYYGVLLVKDDSKEDRQMEEKIEFKEKIAYVAVL